MPEFDFKLSLAEWDGVMNYIFEQEAYIIADNTPNVPILKTKADYNTYLFEQNIFNQQGSVKFHILREDYMQCPLKISSIIKKDGKRIYLTSDRVGGPSILILYFSLVKTGFCFYYPYYFQEEVGYVKHRPPEELVNLYKDIFKYIRKRTVIIKYFGSRKYCGHEYLQQVRDGIITEVEDDFKKLVMEYFDSREKK